jgi:hypothetical protein
MNIPPSEAKQLDLREYQMLLYHWNEMHDVDEVDAPDPDKAQRHIARINNDPSLHTGPGRTRAEKASAKP